MERAHDAVVARDATLPGRPSRRVFSAEYKLRDLTEDAMRRGRAAARGSCVRRSPSWLGISARDPPRAHCSRARPLDGPSSVRKQAATRGVLWVVDDGPRGRHPGRRGWHPHARAAPEREKAGVTFWRPSASHRSPSWVGPSSQAGSTPSAWPRSVLPPTLPRQGGQMSTVDGSVFSRRRHSGIMLGWFLTLRQI
jgi:hypothetical protein